LIFETEMKLIILKCILSVRIRTKAVTEIQNVQLLVAKSCDRWEPAVPLEIGDWRIESTFNSYLFIMF